MLSLQCEFTSLYADCLVFVRSYKILYIFMMKIKPVEFLGDALDALRSFPLQARRSAGFQVDRVQRGLEPDDWKPLLAVGKGVKEIRIWDEGGAFRVMYVAKLQDAVYVLHCFQKKTQRTSKADIELAQDRYKALIRSKK
jgi:phage-related protein